MDMYHQMDLFPNTESLPAAEEQTDLRSPTTVTWNLWHGCHKVSPGCANCYMFRRDHEYGRDPETVRRTANFNLPIRRFRTGEYKGLYKIPAGSTVYTCFTSDFFHKDADPWRPAAWAMIRERGDCTFFMITKRPERIPDCLPPDWGKGYENVHISVTCENQYWADRRLPGFLMLPILHKSITHEPMLEAIDIRRYLEEYGNDTNPDGTRVLESVSCGGESGPKARICDYGWVLNTHIQCVEYGVPFHFHQTGARLRRSVPDGHGGHIQKVYDIPREYQHTQAEKAGLDYGGGIQIPVCLSAESPSLCKDPDEDKKKLKLFSSDHDPETASPADKKLSLPQTENCLSRSQKTVFLMDKNLSFSWTENCPEVK